MELYRFGCGRTAGAVAVGHVIDSWGAQAGFIGVAIAGLLLAFSALCSWADAIQTWIPHGDDLRADRYACS